MWLQIALEIVLTGFSVHCQLRVFNLRLHDFTEMYMLYSARHLLAEIGRFRLNAPKSQL